MRYNCLLHCSTPASHTETHDPIALKYNTVSLHLTLQHKDEEGQGGGDPNSVEAKRRQLFTQLKAKVRCPSHYMLHVSLKAVHEPQAHTCL